MKAHVVIEASAAEYDQAEASGVLDVTVTELMLTQTGGLFSASRRVLLVDPIGPAARAQCGVDDRHPAARFFVQPTPED